MSRERQSGLVRHRHPRRTPCRAATRSSRGPRASTAAATPRQPDLPRQRPAARLRRPVAVGHRHARCAGYDVQVDQGRMTHRLGRAEDRPHPRSSSSSSAAATWFLTRRRSPARRAHGQPLRHLDGRRPRRLRAGDGQLVQEGRQPRARARLRRLRGRLRRCLQQGARDRLRPARAGAGWPRHRRRARHHGGRRRHPRGVQVLQHPGRHAVPQVGHRRDVRLRGASPCSTWC